MARQLWLLRHGEAVPHDSKDDDADRELTARGERQSAAAGAALARLGQEFAAV
jgi:phosphohistidine phosphatase